MRYLLLAAERCDGTLVLCRMCDRSHRAVLLRRAQIAPVDERGGNLRKQRERKNVLFAPGKAVNAGGVATSGLEMTQNAAHLSWSAQEVDDKLHWIMQSIHEQCVKYGTRPDGSVDYVKGANIAGFMKVAQAMLEQGVL